MRSKQSDETDPADWFYCKQIGMSADERFKTPSPFCDFCASLRPIFRAQPSVYSVFSVGTLLRFEMSVDERFAVLQCLGLTHHRH